MSRRHQEHRQLETISFWRILQDAPVFDDIRESHQLDALSSGNIVITRPQVKGTPASHEHLLVYACASAAQPLGWLSTRNPDWGQWLREECLMLDAADISKF